MTGHTLDPVQLLTLFLLGRPVAAIICRNGNCVVTFAIGQSMEVVVTAPLVFVPFGRRFVEVPS